jgi:hypothetical protein
MTMNNPWVNTYQYDINQNVSGLTNKNPEGKLVKGECTRNAYFS